MPFQVIRNDITHMKADAIVNTANPFPIVGDGTDRAIHAAAGPRLLEARKKIGGIAPGHAEATRAYGLNARYVLHAVSPAWRGGEAGEAALLRKTYDAALSLAVHLRCRSVAFPLMAAGSYGFPQELALSIALSAFTDFLLKHDMTLYLVVFSEGAYSLAGSLFDDLKSFIDHNYVEEAARAEYLSPASPVRQRLSHADKSVRMGRIEGAMPEEAPHHAFFGSEPLESLSDTDLESLLKQAEPTFSEALLDLIDERHLKDSEVYHRAEISRQLFNKIINTRDYQPSKSTAIQLALGLRLDLAGTQRLLRRAGYALTRSSKADLVVQYFIGRGEYNLVTINLALDDCGLAPLGAKK